MNAKTILIAVASTIGLGGLLTICGFAMQHWIQIEVEYQLSASGIVPEHEVEAVKTKVGQNTKDIIRVESEGKVEREKIYSKTERIAQILMED